MLMLKKLPVILAGTMLDLSGKWCKLKDVKKGDFVKRKPEAKTVWIRGDYDKWGKAYSLIDADDISHEIFMSGKTLVFIDFTY